MSTILPTSDKLLSALKKNPFVLAPMAGITDVALRAFMHEMGAGIVITELVSATGLKYTSQRTRDLMRFTETHRPVGIQLFGEVVEDLRNAAMEVEQMGADFVDLNFGCPVPKVVKRGAGSGILKDLKQVEVVFKTVKSAIKIPLTVKVRTGWDDSSRNTSELCKIAYNEGLTWVAIHGRTRQQGYDGQADWPYIAGVKKESPIPIIGNGDLVTPQLAVNRLVESGCDGVMIGRGCLKNPWIFQQSYKLWANADFEIKKDFVSMFERLQGHLEAHFDDRMTTLQLKKFCAWFSSGYPESSQFRKLVFSLKDKKELLDATHGFFSRWGLDEQTDTSEGFLMGGHG